MRDTPAMLRELKVVEQRYQAVLQVLDGIPVTEVGPWPTALLGPRIAAGSFCQFPAMSHAWRVMVTFDEPAAC